jgi:hypothetical protein
MLGRPRHILVANIELGLGEVEFVVWAGMI